MERTAVPVGTRRGFGLSLATSPLRTCVPCEATANTDSEVHFIIVLVMERKRKKLGFSTNFSQILEIIAHLLPILSHFLKKILLSPNRQK